MLEEVDEQNPFSYVVFDTDVEYKEHFECTSSYSGKALSRDQNNTFDAFDKNFISGVWTSRVSVPHPGGSVLPP